MGGDVRQVRRRVTGPGDDPDGERLAARWCPRCGDETGRDTGDQAGGQAGNQAIEGHPGCRAALALEPPRFCRHCRRRMKVQVLPVGWTAACVEHGVVRG